MYQCNPDRYKLLPEQEPYECLKMLSPPINCKILNCVIVTWWPLQDSLFVVLSQDFSAFSKSCSLQFQFLLPQNLHSLPVSSVVKEKFQLHSLKPDQASRYINMGDSSYFCSINSASSIISAASICIFLWQLLKILGSVYVICGMLKMYQLL